MAYCSSGRTKYSVLIFVRFVDSFWASGRGGVVVILVLPADQRGFVLSFVSGSTVDTWGSSDGKQKAQKSLLWYHAIVILWSIHFHALVKRSLVTQELSKDHVTIILQPGAGFGTNASLCNSTLARLKYPTLECPRGTDQIILPGLQQLLEHKWAD